MTADTKIRGMEELDEGYFGVGLDHTGRNKFGLCVTDVHTGERAYRPMTKAQVAGLVSHLQKRLAAFGDDDY